MLLPLAIASFIAAGPAGQPARWGFWDAPIPCHYNPSKISKEQFEAFDKARAEINRVVGMDLLSECIDDEPEFWRGYVINIGYLPGAVVGRTRFEFNESTGRIALATIMIDPRYRKGASVPVWQHELLHVIGLDHDHDPNSIMHPEIDDTLFITIYHVLAIRVLYREIPYKDESPFIHHNSFRLEDGISGKSAPTSFLRELYSRSTDSKAARLAS